MGDGMPTYPQTVLARTRPGIEDSHMGIMQGGDPEGRK